MGHTRYNWALKWFSAGLIAVSLLGEPILGSLMAWILFDEGLTWLKLAGGVVILTAICLTVVVERK